MFPLCGARCFYEAITPLRIAGMVNDKNKEVKADCVSFLENGRAKRLERRLWRQYGASMNGVRCTAGSLYIFENSIVLCCLNNMMQVTLNLLVTFKQR